MVGTERLLNRFHLKLFPVAIKANQPPALDVEIQTWLVKVEIMFIMIVAMRFIQLKSVMIRRSMFGTLSRRRN